jgi:hypothetical protein
LSKKVLFDGYKNSGENYHLAKDDPKPEVDAFEVAAQAKYGNLTEDDYKVKLYMIVGLFFHMSWQEFMATPYPICKKLKEEIDEKMLNIQDGEVILDYNHLSMLLSLSRLFGKKD